MKSTFVVSMLFLLLSFGVAWGQVNPQQGWPMMPMPPGPPFPAQQHWQQAPVMGPPGPQWPAPLMGQQGPQWQQPPVMGQQGPWMGTTQQSPYSIYDPRGPLMRQPPGTNDAVAAFVGLWACNMTNGNAVEVTFQPDGNYVLYMSTPYASDVIIQEWGTYLASTRGRPGEYALTIIRHGVVPQLNFVLLGQPEIHIVWMPDPRGFQSPEISCARRQ